MSQPTVNATLSTDAPATFDRFDRQLAGRVRTRRDEYRTETGDGC